MTAYADFLTRKHVQADVLGFDVQGEIHPALFPFQRAIVRWGLRLGRAGIFADCGLGKSPMQLVWAREVVKHTGRPVLILTPLAVAPQMVREAVKFGIDAHQIRDQAEVTGPGIWITNYQKFLRGWDAGQFSGVVLDESSILKSYMGATKRRLISAFAETPYRLCCTATPAPNDYIELGNHSEFLGVMPSSEMLGRWFISDQGKLEKGNRVDGGTGTLTHYRLKGHAAIDFWRWVASWAVCLSRPSDLGEFTDDGFQLPELRIHQEIVQVDATVLAGDQLFRCDSLTATSLHREMRLTAGSRSRRVAELVAKPGQWLLWCNTDYEADALKEVIPEATEIRGPMSEDRKEELIENFLLGKSRILLSKPSICGFGLNLQHVHQMAFVGLSYSHEQFYQAVRRSWRFGQTQPVDCHLVLADTEGEVLGTVQRKERDRQTMLKQMIKATREANIVGSKRIRRTLTAAESDRASGKNWTMALGDSVEYLIKMEDSSVDFTIFSPPFSNLYVYSDALADMGNCADDQEFMEHFGYLVPNLLRVTVPGRLCAVHCKDLPRYAGRDGTAGLKDFPGQIIRLFENNGWSYHSRVTIWKCPVVEMERTKNHGLLYKSVRRDCSAVRQGMADYLILFRRPPADGGLVSDKPIARKNGFQAYVGQHDPIKDTYHPSPNSRHSADDPGLAVWQRYAEPVWWDIDQMDVLNNYREGRGNQDEKHICPLQLQVIERAIHLWSLPGDLVFSPFAGIGSEGVGAIRLGRKFLGVELKREYWQVANRNLEKEEREINQPTLFD